MVEGQPEKGDKVSWNWGAGAPAGTVSEKKTSGQVSVTSKRGNVIKKNATPDNPAVAISRSGNDVVKKVSELNVEKKGSGGGKKRQHDDDDDDDDEEESKSTVTNGQGKEVRPGGKRGKEEEAEEGKEPFEDEAKSAVNEKKKSASKSKGATGSAKKERKPSKPRNTDGVSGRTRSQKK